MKALCSVDRLRFFLGFDRNVLLSFRLHPETSLRGSAPACEESPDCLSALKHSLYDRPVWRGSSQSHRRLDRWRANAEIHCRTQTEPSPRGSLPKAEINAIRNRSCVDSSLCLCRCLLGGFLRDESIVLFPGAILVAVAVGRFADNRSPPTSQWANAVTIRFDPPGPRLWRGQRWRAIRGRGRECGRDSLELFFELESEGATR